MAVTVARQQQPHRLLQTLRFLAQVDCPTVDPSTFDQLLDRLLLHHRHIGEGNKTALYSLGRLPLDDLPEKAIVELFLSLVEASRSVDASLALTYAFIDTFPTETTPVVPQALGSIVRSTARDLRQVFHPAKAFFRLAHSMADIHRLNGPETLQWRRAGRRCPSVKLVDALVRAYVVRLRDLKKREASTKSSGTIAEGVSTEGVKVQGKEVLELVKRFIKEQGNRRRHLTVSDTLELRMASRLLRHEVEDGVVPSQPTKAVAATLPSMPAPETAEHEPLTKVQQADVGSARKILTKQLNQVGLVPPSLLYLRLLHTLGLTLPLRVPPSPQMLTDAFESGGLPSLLATWPQAREATTRVAVWAHYIRLLLSAGEVDRALDVVCELTRPGAPTTTTTTTTTSSPPGVTLRVLVRMLQRARDRDMVMATGFAKEGEEGPAFSTVKARLEREFPELWEKVWQSVCEHPNKDGVDAAQ